MLPMLTESPQSFGIADVGYEYLSAFVALGMEPVCLANASLDAFKSPSSKWFPHRELFSGSMPLMQDGVRVKNAKGDDVWVSRLADAYVNIICSTEYFDFRRKYTVGVPNIAITTAWPQVPTISTVEVLRDYEHVWCPTRDDYVALNAVGVKAQLVVPVPEMLKLNFPG